MHFLIRSLVIIAVFTAPCYAAESAVPEKSLLEKITEYIFPDSSSKTTLAEKTEPNDSENIKKVADVETSKKGSQKPGKQAQKAPTKPLAEISIGRKDAPVVMIDYSSLSCGHCAHFHEDVLPKITEKYIKPGYLRIIFRDYPGDQVSLKAHQLAWCKGEMKYLDLMNILFKSQDKWLVVDDPVEALKSIALQNGISTEQFDSCLKNQELLDQIIAIRLEGQKKYNIKATPTIIINAKIYQRFLSLDEIDKIMKPFLALSKEKTPKG